MPKIFSSGAISFWHEPQEVRDARERKQREYEVKELLREASKNKDAFEAVVDKVCLMIGEKLMSGKITDQNFTLKIQSIIEGLRGLAWPKSQASYTTKTKTSDDPRDWVETLRGLKSLGYRVDENKPSNA
ncbi:MAG: hypothetical protein SFW07_05105 [Gammaproteobacteria bacterium]|nr:hypothetical protein [Gammaproteobacteria bacterium]